MDFDVDFALDFREGNGEGNEFFIDAIRYGTSNKTSNAGKTNQVGAEIRNDIGPLFGGTGFLSAAYDSSYSSNNNKGIELKIPISAFAGVDTSQGLRMFAVISSRTGNISNECIPGNPGANNLGDGADFSVISDQDFFTHSVKISVPQPTTFVISNEAPGYLIDKLIDQGYGDKNLYEVMQLLQPLSGGIIIDKFMDTLAGCLAGSEIFTVPLRSLSDESANPIGINTDGTIMAVNIYGSDYNRINGFITYPDSISGYAQELFTYAADPQYYINTGFHSSVTGEEYKAFAITWSNSAITPIEETIRMPEKGFIVFPNPASDKISVHFVKACGEIHISIFDICGRLVMQVNVCDSSPINISSLDKGMYTICIETEGVHSIEKIIKQ